MPSEEIEAISGLESLEKVKLNLEFERIRIERLKAWGTIFSIIIPLLIAAFSIFYGVWIQNERSKNDFQIKAAEIVMNAASPLAAKNKAIVLYELFPGHLPEGFKEKMLELYGSSNKKFTPK